jgi:phage gp29-like protein
VTLPSSWGALQELSHPGGILARDIYASALASAIANRHAIPDPSFGLQKESAVYELIRRDAKCAQNMAQRQHSVSGTEWHCVEAREGNPLDEAAAHLAEVLLKNIENFDSARFNLASAVFRGSAFAKIIGRRVPRDYVDGVTRMWWVPTFLADVDRRRLRWEAADAPGVDPILNMADVTSTGLANWKPVEHVEWLVQHVYGDEESTLGYGRGLIDAVYHAWFAKQKLVSELLALAERFGQGLVVAKISPDRPGSSEQGVTATIDATVANIAKTKARHVLAIMVGEELELLEPSGTGASLLLDSIKYYDECIAALLVGSVLPGGGGADVGSNARAEVEQGTSDAIVRFDRKLMGSTLTRDVLGLTWDLNRANLLACGMILAERPTIELSHEARETPAEFADLLDKAGKAGVAVTEREAYQRLGLKRPSPGEPVITAPQPPAMPGYTPGMPPPPGAAPSAPSGVAEAAPSGKTLPVPAGGQEPGAAGEPKPGVAT